MKSDNKFKTDSEYFLCNLYFYLFWYYLCQAY